MMSATLDARWGAISSAASITSMTVMQTPDHRDVEQHVQADRHAHHLGQMTCDDGDLAEELRHEVDAWQELRATGLRELTLLASPRSTAAAWNSIAIAFDAKMTTSNESPNPPAMDVARLPARI